VLRMIEINNDIKIIVCVGSGGVGKTSVAAALGLSQAKQKKKVLVLTIDPSRRLKTSLGLTDDGEAQKVWSDQDGELWGLVIDPQKTFDDFIVRSSGSSDSVKKLLTNKLYIQLSTQLSGSQEFTALEVLFQKYKSLKYDLIILDTPPSQHVIDFLNAPQKLMSLFNDGIAKWFRSDAEAGFLTKLLNSGTTQVLNILESLTGAEFMKELRSFFNSIEKWQPLLEQRIAEVQRLLAGPATEFILITSLDAVKIKQARWFLQKVRQGGHKIKCIVVNRTFPDWYHSEVVPKNSVSLNNYFQWQAEKEKLLSDLSSFTQKNETLVLLPELEDGVSDLKTVSFLAERL
jgi:anion-transporting  ArsA/GET3 family ATPase